MAVPPWIASVAIRSRGTHLGNGELAYFNSKLVLEVLVVLALVVLVPNPATGQPVTLQRRSFVPGRPRTPARPSRRLAFFKQRTQNENSP